ncbi:GlcG/HbpS family heme-binding protein [Luteimonas gilva]|nr:heme-binding protein [Luteimonas gilva]
MLHRHKSASFRLPTRVTAAILAAACPAWVAAADGDKAGDVVSVASLSGTGAQRVLQRALAEARTRKENVCVVVLNAAGDLRTAECMDRASSAAFAIALGKATTSAAFRARTRGFEQAVEGGAAELLAAPNMMPIDGGAPVLVDGQVVGAVGVSGGRSDIDGDIAAAAAAAIGAERAR